MTTPSETVEIYCVKCKATTASRDIEAVTMKNGRPATRSTLHRVRHEEIPHRRAALTRGSFHHHGGWLGTDHPPVHIRPVWARGTRLGSLTTR